MPGPALVAAAAAATSALALLSSVGCAPQPQRSAVGWPEVQRAMASPFVGTAERARLVARLRSAAGPDDGRMTVQDIAREEDPGRRTLLTHAEAERRLALRGVQVGPTPRAYAQALREEVEAIEQGVEHALRNRREASAQAVCMVRFGLTGVQIPTPIQSEAVRACMGEFRRTGVMPL